MHGASMGQEFTVRSEEEAGISRLDSMATDEERQQTLDAVRLVTRNRERYWMKMYVNKLVATVPKMLFDCLISGPHIDDVFGSDADDTDTDKSKELGQGEEEDEQGEGEIERFEEESSVIGENIEGDIGQDSGQDLGEHISGEPQGVMYEAIILKLGSFYRYQMYSPASSLLRIPG
jgi:hypothetical protein